jgi:hypothetical protein
MDPVLSSSKLRTLESDYHELGVKLVTAPATLKLKSDQDLLLLSPVRLVPGKQEIHNHKLK